MKKIELDAEIDDMSEADLRETFSDVMEAHEANAAEFAELQEDAEKAGEFSERVEELESDVEEAAQYFAEKASDVTQLSAGILVDRFSIDELVDLAAQADEAAFSQETVEESTEDDGDNEDESLFADKPQKSPKFSAGREEREEAAKDRLSRISGISFD